MAKIKNILETLTIVIYSIYFTHANSIGSTSKQPIHVSAHEYGVISKSVKSFNSSQESSSQAQQVGDLSNGLIVGNGTLMLSQTNLDNNLETDRKDHILKQLLNVRNPSFDRLVQHATNQESNSENSVSGFSMLNGKSNKFNSYKVNSSIVSVLNEVLRNKSIDSQINFKPTVFNIGAVRKHGNKVLNNGYMTANKTISIQNGTILCADVICPGDTYRCVVTQTTTNVKDNSVMMVSFSFSGTIPSPLADHSIVKTKSTCISIKGKILFSSHSYSKNPDPGKVVKNYNSITITAVSVNCNGCNDSHNFEHSKSAPNAKPSVKEVTIEDSSSSKTA